MGSLASKIVEMLASIYAWWRGVWEAKGVAIAFAFFALMFLWVGMHVMGPKLNTLDPQGWRCEVVSAETAAGGMGLRGGASRPYVVVHTKNCGKINVSGKTVNSDSKELVAASFEPGSEWIFELGWYARNYSMKIERRPPSVEVYHRVS